MKSQRNKAMSLSKTNVKSTENPKRILRSNSKKALRSTRSKAKQPLTKNLKSTPIKSIKTSPIKNLKCTPTKNIKTSPTKSNKSLTISKTTSKKTQQKKKYEKPKNTNLKSKIIEDENKMETEQRQIIVEDENITILQKGGGIVDIHCDNHKSYIVVKDKKNYNSYLSAILNYCNVKFNNNKFYIIQVLHNESDDNYYFYRRWGRNGFKGQIDKIVNYINLALPRL
jgi:poly [ADP-ribose] polymerase